jgi:hypothetical protein
MSVSIPTWDARLWRLLILAFVLISSTFNAFSDASTLKPFHIFFTKYTKDPKDGSYTFFILLEDLVPKHIGRWENPRALKIGDSLGRYKITAFTGPIFPPDDGGDRFTKLDISELTLQDTNKSDDKFQVRYHTTYNIPNLGDSYIPK